MTEKEIEFELNDFKIRDRENIKVGMPIYIHYGHREYLNGVITEVDDKNETIKYRDLDFNYDFESSMKTRGYLPEWYLCPIIKNRFDEGLHIKAKAYIESLNNK